MRISDWSSDVCSSDLHGQRAEDARRVAAEVGRRDVAGAQRAAVVAQAGVAAGDRGADRPRPAFGDATRDIGVGTETLLAAVEAVARRSEERRVGKGGVSTCRSGWSPYH